MGVYAVVELCIGIAPFAITTIFLTTQNIIDT